MDPISGSSDSSLSVDENSSNSDTDPESLVDGTSSKFNPLIALHCEQTALKSFQSDSPKYLHIYELEKAIPDPKELPVCKSQLTIAQKPKEKPVIPVRKFLPHQFPVYRPPKKLPNVLTAMTEAQGPLAALQNAITKKVRMKIWTRSLTGIRGFCTAFVLAFDHHWNLSLRDVHEMFQRKRATHSKEAVHMEEGIECKDKSSKTIIVKHVMLSEIVPLLVNSTDAHLTFREHSHELTSNPYLSKPNDKKNETKSVKTKGNQGASLSASQLRKNRLTVFKEPVKDPFGFSVIARSKNFEIVERYQKQLFLMGNEIVFIEIF